MADGTHLKRKLGISRRDLIRRGVVVGGTLLWTVPVITSISRAHIRAAHSPASGCCECRNRRNDALPLVGCPQPQSEVDTPSKCAHACHELGYRSSQFHTAPGHDTLTCVEPTGCIG
ncbi:MAG TPA: hypothetical protein VNP94_08255, partial [Actinomycetota bacterium]|nr:hypothetical protein [Actinomycetota bacterium]